MTCQLSVKMVIIGHIFEAVVLWAILQNLEPESGE